MINDNPIKSTVWDAVALGIPTWEIEEYSSEALRQADSINGHHTIKVDPLADKRLLRDHGFYYCDTLLEPYCKIGRLRATMHAAATIEKNISVEQVLPICHGAFLYGRFHRDFELPTAAADLRYDNWLRQLVEAQQVYGLYWDGDLAGFIAYSENNLVLHAIDKKYRGRGLAKYWWSAVCGEILKGDHHEVRSSISAANLAVLNLYNSLGFSLRSAKDVYHRAFIA